MSSLRILYGSVARGDADHLSDRDILAVGDGADADYTWREVGVMHAYGSLFLHHLRLEGKIIHAEPEDSSRWTTLMSTLPPYRRTAQDLSAFSQVICDVISAIRRRDSSAVYEAGVVARLVRHLSILACYTAGSPNFSRCESVIQASLIYQVPLPDGLPFSRLYDSLLNPDAFRAGVQEILHWTSFARSLNSDTRRRLAMIEDAHAHCI